MNVAIVANGHLDKNLLVDIRRSDFIIGVDYASYWLLGNGIAPDVAIGDFDSVTKKELQIIKKKVDRVIEQEPHPKYVTDLDLAIDYAISKKPKEVAIYGAIGHRFDHTQIAVNLLEKLLKKHINGKILDQDNEVSLLDSRRTILNSPRYKYLSVLSYTQKSVVTMRGVLYPVIEHKFYRPESLGVSNEIVGKSAEVTVHSGIALIIQSRDRSK